MPLFSYNRHLHIAVTVFDVCKVEKITLNLNRQNVVSVKMLGTFGDPLWIITISKLINKMRKSRNKLPKIFVE